MQMDKNYLLQTAAKLPDISSEAADEYFDRFEQLLSKMNYSMLERNDIETLIGKDNTRMMMDNHANHLRFMGSIFKNRNDEVLVETILWVFRAYRSHNFTTNYWAAQINTWIDILPEILSSETYKNIYPYYEWIQINIPLFVMLSDEVLNNSLSMH